MYLTNHLKWASDSTVICHARLNEWTSNIPYSSDRPAANNLLTQCAATQITASGPFWITNNYAGIIQTCDKTSRWGIRQQRLGQTSSNRAAVGSSVWAAKGMALRPIFLNIPLLLLLPFSEVLNLFHTSKCLLARRIIPLELTLFIKLNTCSPRWGR